MIFLKTIYYSIIDIFTLKNGVKRTINNIVIYFPARWSRYYNNSYEESSFDFFKKHIKSGNTILDIGAHIGVYSVYFGKLHDGSCNIFSFEPTKSTCDVLKKVVRLNKLDKNVTVIHSAVSDRDGFVNFNLTTEDGLVSNANSIVNISSSKNTVQVPCVSIDSFRKQNKLKLDVLKIDVEGAELSVLHGAKETFLNDRPFVLLALHPSNIKDFGHSLELIWDCLESYNMEVFLNGLKVEKNSFCNQINLFDVQLIPRS